MNTASLELCKELFNLSDYRWDGTDKLWLCLPIVITKGSSPELNYSNWQVLNYSNWQVKPASYRGRYSINHYPAYDLGYLLRKLPKTVDFPEKALAKIAGGMSAPAYLVLCQHIDNPNLYWDVAYQHEDDDYWIEELRATADTPEDAVCKLAIELFKQGVLGGEK